jgi:hypothetical protein
MIWRSDADRCGRDQAESPTQIYFVPRAEVKTKFATTAHDFRYDLATLGAGSESCTTCTPRRWKSRPRSFRRTHAQYAKDRRASAKKIGDAGADLADDRVGLSVMNGVFFKHQRMKTSKVI